MGKPHKKLRPEKTEALQKQYDAYIEADKKRKERNEYILWKMNDMRTLSYANHLQPQINHSDYRHKYFLSPLINQPCTSNQVSNVICKNNGCNEEILRVVSKDFILIPKQHRCNLKSDSHNFFSSDQTVDWRSKYQILDKLKQIEKDNIDVPVRDETNSDDIIETAVPSSNLETKIGTKQFKSEIYEYKQEQATEIIYGIPVDSDDKRELAQLYCTDTLYLTPQAAVRDTGDVIQKDGIFNIKPKVQTEPVNYSIQQQHQNTTIQPTFQTNREAIVTANLVPNFKENPIDNEYEGIEPTEILNVITPYADVELKDGHTIYPACENAEAAIDGPAWMETVNQLTLDPVTETNVSAHDPNAESELEAESRMFYQEQPLDQNSSDVDYTRNLQENLQDEHNVYYEQKLAETTSVGEFDETDKKYDQSYEQQYNPLEQQYNNIEGYVEQPEYIQVDSAANDYSRYYAVDGQQQPYAEQQLPYNEPQQPFAEPQQPYAEPQQLYAEPQQPYAEPQQPYAEQQLNTEPQQPYAEQQQPYAEPLQPYAEQQLNTEPQQPYAEQQQTYAQQQQPYADQHQSYVDSQQSYVDPKQSYTDHQQSYSAQQQSYADHQKSFADPKQAVPDPQQAIADQQQSIADPQQPFADPQQPYADQQQSVADINQYVADQQLSAADPLHYPVDQQQPYTDQDQYYTDPQQSYADQQQQPFAAYNLESHVDKDQEGFVAYNAKEAYDDNTHIQEYDTEMDQQSPEQGYIVSEEGYNAGTEVYGTVLPETQETESPVQAQEKYQITPVAKVKASE